MSVVHGRCVCCPALNLVDRNRFIRFSLAAALSIDDQVEAFLQIRHQLGVLVVSHVPMGLAQKCVWRWRYQRRSLNVAAWVVIQDLLLDLKHTQQGVVWSLDRKKQVLFVVTPESFVVVQLLEVLVGYIRILSIRLVVFKVVFLRFKLRNELVKLGLGTLQI